MLFRKPKQSGVCRAIESLEQRLCFAATDISGLVLYNADSGQPIGPFENNTTLNYASLPANLSVRANAAGSAGSVRFGVDANTALHTENFAPYFIQGERPSGLPNPWTSANGTHQMSVTGYSGADGSGEASAPFAVTFHVANAPTGAPVVTGTVVRFSDADADAKEAGLDKGTWVISRSGGSTSSALAVSYNLAGSATNGVDYQTLTGTITIPAGSSSVNLVVTPKDDSLAEVTEDVVATLIAGNGYSVGSPASANTPITDNDTGSTPPPPTPGSAVVSFSDASADAKEAGLDSGTWMISRTGSTASPLNVGYNVSGSASNGVDYQAFSGTITIPAGKSSVNLVVTPKEDTLVEGTETVTVTLNLGNGYSLGSVLTASCPIQDNDSVGTPPPGPQQGISDITWSRNGPRSPVPRTEGGSVQIGSKIYAIGGFTAEGGTGSFFPLTRRMHVYDMATRQWSELASIPSSAAGNHFGAATDGANIYIVSGQIGHTYGAGTNTAWKYNIASNQWTPFTSLPEIRFGGAAFVENGLLHYVGGDKADRETPTTEHWAINLANPAGGWVRMASMPLPGDHLSHAAINGKVYLFGGEHGHHGLTPGDENGYIQHNYTFEYNPANDTWTRKANMPLALSHIEGSTLVINGKAVLIGGLLTGGNGNMTSRVHVYDPVANTWKTLSTRYPKRIIGSESGYWNGKIYMTDGFSVDESDRQVGFEGTVKFA